MASERVPMMTPLACLCGRADYRVEGEFTEPPPGEVRFDLGQASRYFRQLLRCKHCGHFRSMHAMDMSHLYAGAYVNSTYGDDGIRRAFDRITRLDPEKSDNYWRVQRVLEFAAGHFSGRAVAPSILDVGSGLCVFLHRMKAQAGWECTALDPDPRAVEHARQVVGVNGICADFMRDANLGAYDVIAFNKVLEHVVDPVAMLAKAGAHLNGDGFIYIELPDGEAAAVESLAREEFFVDHHHVFSVLSLHHLVKLAGFEVLRLDRLVEPSSKYTLCAYLGRRSRGGSDAQLFNSTAVPPAVM